jgi:hypothetical protein
MSLMLGLLALAITSSALAQTNLSVIRHHDNTLWKMTCDGTAPCSDWTQINGRFAVQPTLSWDPSIGKYILIGIGNNATSLYKATFNSDGSWNNDWVLLTGASPSPVASAAGDFYGLVWMGAWDAGTAYRFGDAVNYGGSSFISIGTGNTNHLPTEPSFWAMLAAQGTAGPTGATGEQGLSGLKGDTGAAGATGSTGEQGVVGPTGPTGQKGDKGEPGSPGNLALAGAKCSPGKFLVGFDEGGSLVCAWSLPGTDFSVMGISLLGEDLSYANLAYSIFSNNDLTGVDITYGSLVGVHFNHGTILDNTNFANANLTGAHIEIRPVSLVGTNFTNANMTSTWLDWATLSGVTLSGAKLAKANLGGTDLRATNLTGVVWGNTICPDETNSSTNGTVPESCEGHLAPPP